MKIQTAFRLEPELIKALKKEAKKQNRTLSNLVEFILYKEIKKVEKKENHE